MSLDADRLLADRLTPQARARSAAGEWPDELWAALDEVGLPAAILPEEAGLVAVPGWEIATSWVKRKGYTPKPVPDGGYWKRGYKPIGGAAT